MRNQEFWNTAEDARTVIAILLFIQKLSSNKTDRKTTIMANVEADADLYLGTQRLDQRTDKFYKTFTVQVDMIKANGGSAGFHNGVYNKRTFALLVQGPCYRILTRSNEPR